MGRSFEIFTSLLYLFLLLYFILFYFPFYVFFFSKYYSPSLSYSFFIPLQRRFHYLLLVLIRKSKLSWSKKVDIISFKAYHPATKNIQKEIHKRFAIFLRVYFVNIKYYCRIFFLKILSSNLRFLSMVFPPIFSTTNSRK